jgi:hypothetical protein
MKRSILTEKIARHGLHLTREYSVNPADTMFVRDIIRSETQPIPGGAADRHLVVSGYDGVDAIYPDQTLQKAAKSMVENNVSRLVVISRDEQQKVIGYIERSDIFRAWERQFEEEDVRERQRHVPMLTPRLTPGSPSTVPVPSASKHL